MTTIPKTVDLKSFIHPPKQVRAWCRLRACVKAGRESSAYMNQVVELFKDDSSAAEVSQWAERLDLLHSLLLLKRKKAHGIRLQLQRRDLTFTEVMGLNEALNECVQESEIIDAFEECQSQIGGFNTAD
jgi:hypothetical protein